MSEKLNVQVRAAMAALDRLVVPERDGTIGAAYCALVDAYARIRELEVFVKDIAARPSLDRLKEHYFRVAAELTKD